MTDEWLLEIIQNSIHCHYKMNTVLGQRFGVGATLGLEFGRFEPQPVELLTSQRFFLFSQSIQANTRMIL